MTESGADATLEMRLADIAMLLMAAHDLALRRLPTAAEGRLEHLVEIRSSLAVIAAEIDACDVLANR